jgi:hypothetical protein
VKHRCLDIFDQKSTKMMKSGAFKLNRAQNKFMAEFVKIDKRMAIFLNVLKIN